MTPEPRRPDFLQDAQSRRESVRHTRTVELAEPCSTTPPGDLHVPRKRKLNTLNVSRSHLASRLQCGFDRGKRWFWDRVPFTHVAVDPPRVRDIRMYTLLPAASGSIGGWAKVLDHAASMNFNMIHLLPVTRLSDSGSPYAAGDLFSIDPSYLDPEKKADGLGQFEDFVEGARRKGIGLCIDLSQCRCPALRSNKPNRRSVCLPARRTFAAWIC